MALTARMALISPRKPAFRAVELMGMADRCSPARSMERLIPGFKAIIRAATPLTWEVAMEVPESSWYLPFSQVETIRSPGA
ncbi:hypothetical protein D3C75_1060730 [compost metagenome]